MRIAYLTFERPGVGSGVGKKIDFHTRCWRDAGHEVVNFVLNVPGLDGPIEGVRYIFSPGKVKPMLQAALKSHQLRSELKAFRPDVVHAFRCFGFLVCWRY